MNVFDLVVIEWLLILKKNDALQFWCSYEWWEITLLLYYIDLFII